MNRTPVTDGPRAADAPERAEEPIGSEPAGGVPKDLVHRAHTADVLLTAWEDLGDGRFTVRAKWPDTHDFFAPMHGKHDPVLIVETLRQSAILLCHAAFAVPLDHHFHMEDLHYRSHPEFLDAPDGTTELHLDVTCSDIRRRGGRLAATDVRIRVRDGDRTVVTGGGHLGISTPRVYQRLRGAHFPPALATLAVPVSHRLVGRDRPAHVVLATTPVSGRWQLRADTRNTTLFGRAIDHYPGLVLVEAAHQAARALLSPAPFYPASFTIDFHRYVEFAPPCWVEAHTVPSLVPGGTAVRVTGHQDGTPAFTASLTSAAR
ncbi:ScbA/BarX family gamma-butyrolactone biosynthesis protein [Streptomyces sp. SP18BB07]|uniref:ScbA/BarX family gamma-butyrolactone biosynthesis protein n=1 Tax=Streptomyces sp. SP18BB07 TaxID=3002522 RepID=UPI002E771C3B|nr:ScbA/BarX family gamma-butyrolactone biosynthesis protein [Streptomyces sp. SP18BB07]MEE1758772.1 ScbA/BarX family gamma-butyrolactone biosynthesis protein [Streptomyces sp. SP18BB07]